jgi:hypothetical protein
LLLVDQGVVWLLCHEPRAPAHIAVAHRFSANCPFGKPSLTIGVKLEVFVDSQTPRTEIVFNFEMTMEQSPSPPRPPKSSSTPKFYMTPQLAKRKDGLCPRLLHEEEKEDKPGYVSKRYQTNSVLLLQTKQNDGIPKEVLELQTMVESINKALKSTMQTDQGVIGLSFKAEGCKWKVDLDPALNRAGKTYRMEVVCSANSSSPSITKYVVDSILIPKVAVDPNPLSPPVIGFKEAKEIFEMVALKVRKSIVRLEFPSFPDGCQGRAFKDVYQLNARVSVVARAGGKGPAR